MYSLQELEAMAPAETIAIAEGMGMKKANSSDIQEVMYYILDNQASATAKKEASKVAARQSESKKRGRKKKTVQSETEPSEAKKEENISEETNAQPEKKKRGRKPKNQPSTELPQPEEPAEEGTPEVSKAEGEPQAPKAKRGRKAKDQKAQSQEEIPTEDNKELPEQKTGKTQDFTIEEYNLEAGEKASGTVAEVPSEKAERTKNNKATFDSFFGKNKGRTFTPRGQQPIEEAAHQNESAPTAPLQQPSAPLLPVHHAKVQPEPKQVIYERPQQILLQEPGANSQTPKRDQQKNKRGRQFNRQQDIDKRFPAAALEGKLKVYGVLEIMPEGFGFLRSSDFNYLPSPDDIYISQQQIKQYGLRVGDVVEAEVRLPLPEEKYYPMVKPVSINGLEPSKIRDRAKFEHLTPLFPDEKFDITKGKSANISTRIVDMFAPIGKGQRALIVAPPKTGKTILLKDIANAISENHPETYILMLIIDERPEEVTDMARIVNAEVIASTFDEPADRHVRIAGIVLEKAKRLVESGHDVVIMLDSITRLARAYNTVSPASGKILSGGVDANALQRPKRFFGAARNIEGGGSLTIIATALTETSSKMDEVIFEEFKGTGNMELQLDRKLSNKRIFPAVDIVASSTRRDDLLLPDETLNRMWILRNYLGDMNSLEAMEFMKKRMEMSRSNEELLVTMDQ